MNTNSHMEHNTQTTTGNARIDGGLLVILTASAIISKITLSGAVTVLTAIGAVLYVANQAIQLYNNLKAKKNDRIPKKNKQNRH